MRGLLVYALDGRIVSRLDSGRINNVDLRAGIRVGGQETIVVAGTNRTTKTLDILALDAGSGQLSPLGDPIEPDFAADPYGICLYHSAVSGGLYVFANAQDGAVGQWRLDGRRPGRPGRLAQSAAWTLDSQPEGCVADDANGWLFIGEEEAAIWRFDAEPTAPTDRPDRGRCRTGRGSSPAAGAWRPTSRGWPFTHRRAAATGTVTSWRPARATIPTWCTTAPRPTPTAARSGLPARAPSTVRRRRTASIWLPHRSARTTPPACWWRRTGSTMSPMDRGPTRTSSSSPGEDVPFFGLP